jgi:hypothetical protein
MAATQWLPWVWPPVSGAVPDVHALRRGLSGQFGQQAGLADAVRAGQQDALHRARRSLVVRRQQPRQLGYATDKGRPDDDGRRCRLADAQQPAILCQHLRLDRSQVGSRLDAQLLDQSRSGPLVGAQRVGLATRPVQSGHQLTPEPLPPGMPADQRLELANQFRIGAAGQVGGYPVLHRREPQLLERIPLRNRERRVELRVRLSSPQLERVPQFDGRCRGPSRTEVPPASRREDPEPLRVDLRWVDGGQVPRAACEHEGRTVTGQGPPQPGDVNLHRLLGSGRRLVRPDSCDDRRHRKHPEGRREQERQHGTLPAAGYVQQARTVTDLERSENTERNSGVCPRAARGGR